MSRIEVTREPAAWRDRLRSYRILIDGQEIGRIKPGETQTFDVASGSHAVQMRIDWGVSPSVPVTVGPGETARLTCRPGGPAWRGLIDVFRPKQYVHLEHAATRPSGP